MINRNDLKVPLPSSSVLQVESQVIPSETISRLPQSQPIPHETESVVTPIFQVEVLGPEFLQDLLIMQHPSCIHSRDFPIDFAVLEPRPTAGCPNHAL
jgi:hypothetical protein